MFTTISVREEAGEPNLPPIRLHYYFHLHFETKKDTCISLCARGVRCWAFVDVCPVHGAGLRKCNHSWALSCFFSPGMTAEACGDNVDCCAVVYFNHITDHSAGTDRACAMPVLRFSPYLGVFLSRIFNTSKAPQLNEQCDCSLTGLARRHAKCLCTPLTKMRKRSQPWRMHLCAHSLVP